VSRLGASRRPAIKPLFAHGPSENTRLLVFALLSVALMTLDHRQHHLGAVRAVLDLAVAPLQHLVSLPAAAGRSLDEALASRQRLLEENAELRARALLLEARLQKLAALEAENRRLRELLDASFKVGERVLIAELLAVDLEPFSQQVVLDKGGLRGVYVGQPLLDAHGVLGQVVAVSPLTSRAMLVTDPSHAVPVRVNRNGLRAVAVGTGSPDRLEVPHLPNNADVRPGDLLVTSGLGGRFPAGYPVATVERVERDPARPFARVLARPTAHVERSQEVLLVWPARPLAAAGKEGGQGAGLRRRAPVPRGGGPAAP